MKITTEVTFTTTHRVHDNGAVELTGVYFERSSENLIDHMDGVSAIKVLAELECRLKLMSEGRP